MNYRGGLKGLTLGKTLIPTPFCVTFLTVCGECGGKLLCICTVLHPCMVGFQASFVVFKVVLRLRDNVRDVHVRGARDVRVTCA